MGDVIMSGSIIATIILCFVGIIKLPFKKFKEQHPTAYKIVFYSLSLILVIVIPILCGLYMLNLSLKSLEFYVLMITTVAGVFGLYGTYEGTELKTLVATIVEKIKQLCNKYSDSKLTKIIQNVGIDKLNELAQTLNKEEVVATAKIEQPDVTNITDTTTTQN